MKLAFAKLICILITVFATLELQKSKHEKFTKNYNPRNCQQNYQAQSVCQCYIKPTKTAYV